VVSQDLNTLQPCSGYALQIGTAPRVRLSAIWPQVLHPVFDVEGGPTTTKVHLLIQPEKDLHALAPNPSLACSCSTFPLGGRRARSEPRTMPPTRSEIGSTTGVSVTGVRPNSYSPPTELHSATTAVSPSFYRPTKDVEGSVSPAETSVRGSRNHDPKG